MSQRGYNYKLDQRLFCKIVGLIPVRFITFLFIHIKSAKPPLCHILNLLQLLFSKSVHRPSPATWRGKNSILFVRSYCVMKMPVYHKEIS